MQTEQNISSSKNESFNITSTLREYLQYWKLFIALISLSILIASVIYFTTSPQYSIVSSVLLKENEGLRSNGNLASLEDLGLISSTSNIDNEVVVFKSPDLMAEVVKSLELQTVYWENTGLKKMEVYKETPYYVTLEGLLLDKEENIELNIEVKEKDELRIQGTSFFMGIKAEFSETLETLPGYIDLPNKGGRLFVSKNKDFQGDLASEYFIKVYNVDDVSEKLIGSLTINAETKNASVLNMIVIVENREKGRDILTELVTKYNADNVKENNQTAFNTANFINDRLKDITLELGSVEGEVEEYKQGQGITNLSSETQLYMEQTAANEQKKLEIETQLGVISMVETYINKNENTDRPIPNIGITDPALVGAITTYNTKLLEYESISVAVGDENPMKLQLKGELSQMHSSIKESIFSVKNAMRLSKKNIDFQNSTIAARIHSLPKQERGLLEKMRQQQIKENLYLFLLQKREETSISMAATPSKAKIVTKPRFLKKEAPDLKKIYAFSLLVGVLLGVAIVYFRGLFRVTIINRKELEDLARVPVIGQIAKNEGAESIVVAKGATSSLIELFRNLRNSIGFILGSEKKAVVMVTSTIAGEGKSFICSNLAASFALNSKKVLIVGLDIRNPQLAKNFELTVSQGITSYLNGDIEDWRELVKPYAKQPNLHVLQAGVVPPNPNELLMTPLLEGLINEAKEEYDVVILDTAPVGIISDTYLLNKYPDITLYIVREGFTHKDSIDFINDQKESNRLPNVYLVLNDVDPNNENYRYGYGRAYGYGGN